MRAVRHSAACDSFFPRKKASEHRKIRIYKKIGTFMRPWFGNLGGRHSAASGGFVGKKNAETNI